jgi:hypothetical protein
MTKTENGGRFLCAEGATEISPVLPRSGYAGKSSRKITLPLLAERGEGRGEESNNSRACRPRLLDANSVHQMQSQVISKQRVTDHGEVFTAKREVSAMLDLVKQETERIESRFLEPACGDGNFLTEILERKLRVVESRYGKNQLEYERYAVLAVTSVYGIDILADNVLQCRQRLFEIFNQHYTAQFKSSATDECRDSVKFILERNIIHGDALSLKTPGDNPQPIVFSEWSPVNGSMIKRRDFTFSGLIPGFLPSPELFPEPDLFSDLGENVFIPKPQKDFPLTHFLKLGGQDEPK